MTEFRFFTEEHEAPVRIMVRNPNGPGLIDGGYEPAKARLVEHVGPFPQHARVLVYATLEKRYDAEEMRRRAVTGYPPVSSGWTPVPRVPPRIGRIAGYRTYRHGMTTWELDQFGKTVLSIYNGETPLSVALITADDETPIIALLEHVEAIEDEAAGAA